MEESSIILEGDFQLHELMKYISFVYTDIITEFADVEIFLISIDSLLLELTSHNYHNWDLGGQTIVLSRQISRFLTSLENLNAKFKLVLFSDFSHLVLEDNFFSFLHSFAITYLMSSQWSDRLITFKNPIDVRWKSYLHDLTPSFILMSLNNANKNCFKEIDYSRQLISIAIQLNTIAMPVVLFNSFRINFTSVMAYRMTIVPLEVNNLDEKIEQCWMIPEYTIPDRKLHIDNIVDFWGLVVKELVDKFDSDERTDFENFCISILIFAFVSKRKGIDRRYFGTADGCKGPSKSLINFRNKFFSAAKHFVDRMNIEIYSTKNKHDNNDRVTFFIEDLWDGRLIWDIYKKVSSGEKILPFRLQEEYSKLHQLCGIISAPCTDENDFLLDPPNLSPDNPRKRLIDNCDIYAISSELIFAYMPEFAEVFKGRNLASHAVDFAQTYSRIFGFQFRPIKERILKEELRPPNPNSRFQLFSDSLEGRGTDLLVDFSRNPRLNAINEENSENKSHSESKNTKKGNAGGTKKVKELQLSKKDQILKANADVLNKKQVEKDKAKIAFATQVKANAIIALEEVMKCLDLDESKALCAYEKVLRYAEVFAEQLPTFENLDRKREAALELVGALKLCFVQYIQYFNDHQKEKINILWSSLGFSSFAKKPEKNLNLEMDFVYYQLFYGGRLIDVKSDPKKDERVSGFYPDAWQREMLDAVDQDKSALIIAPTSAGKTFVSYYCIERILRRSSDEVVVYISPSKALTNQVIFALIKNKQNFKFWVIGSVYARFRNKSMVGGRVLYGVLTTEINDNATNCQVLVTTPDCFEQMLLSCDFECQKFVSRIRYLILDEIHCLKYFDTYFDTSQLFFSDKSISSIAQGHIWEHIFLLSRCPFLALSATVHNINELQDWLQSAEKLKPVKSKHRVVELITYDERWSELELYIQRVHEAIGAHYENDDTLFRGRASSLSTSSSAVKDIEIVSENGDIRPTPEFSEERSFIPSPMLQPLVPDENLLLQFNPFGVYKLEKLKMFRIPFDQKLTARQVLDFYTLLSTVDTTLTSEFEPGLFFKKKLNLSDTSFLWLNRYDLRDLESKLKSRFMDWLEKDPEKINKVFENLEGKMHEELEKRSKPFNMKRTALYNIVPLMDHLKKRGQIPALCFNDDRDICEDLAVRLFNEFQSREDNYMLSDEFRKKYNLKAEEKAEKIAKRRRDEEERQARRKKEKRKDEDGNTERYEKEDETQDVGFDQIALQKIRMRDDLDRFKLRGRSSDAEIYDRVVENLQRISHRTSTQKLLKLFERGIGFHHDGLGNSERSAVEVLFRRGFLGVVFSTSTLALGMNLPCKTVIFGVDTPKLTPLQFRQMSGRAGRRGFDPAGNVIFMSLPTSKIRRLLTANLATLRGNVPYTTSFILRLLGFINDGENTATQTPAKSVGIKGKQIEVAEHDTTNLLVRKQAALTLLQVPFVLYTRSEHDKNKKGYLSSLLKCLAFFNIQLLRKLQFINEKCQMKGFANLATYLNDYEPGNLIFVKLLQEGVLIRLFKKLEKDGETRQKIKDVLVNIVAHIFTQKQLPLNTSLKKDLEKEPILKNLPEEISSYITEYNEYVNKLLVACLQLVSLSNNLNYYHDTPLIDPVFMLTGKLDPEKVTIDNSHLVSVFNDHLIMDDGFVPTIPIKRCDHRGSEIYQNSYAYDFWKLDASKVKQGREMLAKHNRLMVSEMWYMINDFNKILESVKNGLRELTLGMKELREEGLKDLSLGTLSTIFDEISIEFDEKFRRAFNMTAKKTATTETAA